MWKVVKTDEALQRLRDGGRARPKGMYGYFEAYREHIKRYNTNGIPIVNYIPTINMFFSDKDWEIWVEPPSEKERLDKIFNLLLHNYNKVIVPSVDDIKDWYRDEKKIREE
ncbi:MAG TPA: hypothetical protein VMW10_10145, partial [Alphaproteobacteria bacterium]|nr:hypothetical protein [Alphaproteobacteria bacterium]